MSKRVIESYRRRLATEEGWILKRGAQLRVALCYPNVYGVGMANLGFQSVYELFNKIPEVSCERVFLPEDSELREYERAGTPLLSFESQTPVRDFDIVAFSISFETDYLNMARMLKLSGVPVWAKDRTHHDPVIIMGGAALESTRILLNSKSRQHPQGFGNSSGALGHYLVDHFGGIGAAGFFRRLAGRDPINEDGKATGLFIPRFRNLDQQTRHPKFIRGYGFEGGSATSMFPGMARRIEGFGPQFKKQVRRYYTAPVGITVRAAMLSRFENYVEIDSDGVVDAWGIPVLKMHVDYSDNEREMAKDAAETSEEILRAAGAEVVSTGGQITAPGRIIHEMGTARMGHDPKTSVLNKFNQMHDVKNVFVTDGAAFVNSANQNPTLTILALTMRACEYLADEYKRGSL
ncbi:MAG TPA: GMC oxidoreductase [Pyrinomonadaceae bacterium]|nr:GMC oxidoreductase [Pyrinomonadaceae bacterium]